MSLIRLRYRRITIITDRGPAIRYRSTNGIVVKSRVFPLLVGKTTSSGVAPFTTVVSANSYLGDLNTSLLRVLSRSIDRATSLSALASGPYLVRVRSSIGSIVGLFVDREKFVELLGNANLLIVYGYNLLLI